MRTYIITGNPIPQGRARAYTRPGMPGVRFYDPEKSKDWKNLIRYHVLDQKPELISEGPVCMKVVFSLKRPKSLPKKVEHHVKKPDLDNLLKAVKDALKGICWHDDSQVVRTEALKKYAVESGREGVLISISADYE
jgi:Holliday junction resolvase RusA-like endonuclease